MFLKCLLEDSLSRRHLTWQTTLISRLKPEADDKTSLMTVKYWFILFSNGAERRFIWGFKKAPGPRFMLTQSLLKRIKPERKKVYLVRDSYTEGTSNSSP